MCTINRFVVNCLLVILLCGSTSKVKDKLNYTAAPLFKLQDESVRVAYCDLIADPRKYDGKIVTTEAIAVINTVLVIDGADEFLYDPKCHRSESSSLLLEFESSVATDPDALKARDKIIAKASLNKKPARVKELIVGRFYGPDLKGGYGHLGWARFKLGVFGIQKAEEVPEETPWPTGYSPAK